MGGCYSAVREKKQPEIIHTTSQKAQTKTDLWQAYVEYEANLEEITDVVSETWQSTNLYALSTCDSNISVDHQAQITTTKEVQADHPLTSINEETSHNVELDVPPYQVGGADMLREPSSSRMIRDYSSLDEFDEPRPKKLRAMIRENSDFLEFQEPTPVKTNSGRWGMIVVNHLGTDGMHTRAMVKTQGAPPEMRKFSSFEMRSFQSFERRMVVS